MTKVDLFHNLRVKFNELSLREHLIVEETTKELEQENNKLLDVINNQDVKIADLEKEIARLTTNEKSLLAERKILVKENAELKHNKKTVVHLADCLEEKMKERIEELEQQIEKMKCCENCKYRDCNKTSSYQTCWYCKNKDKWELKE